MDSLKDGAVIANIGAGHETESANESRAEIRNDVAVQILHQKHVVLIRVHHELHAGVVNNVFAVSDLGVFFGNVARTPQEKAVR